MSARRVARWWAYVKPHMVSAVIFTGFGIVVSGMAAVSYEHEFLLARSNRQEGWVAAVLPLSVDGMIAIASVAVLWGLAAKAHQLWRPFAVLGLGVAATISANLFSSLEFPWLRPAVSAWSGVAIVAVADVAMWFVTERRRLAAPPEPKTPPAHSCPSPPVSLSEALPLAKAELRARGDEYGEERLADRFSVTRHRVRQIFAEPVEVSMNGSGPHA